jgi:hypothetical protein
MEAERWGLGRVAKAENIQQKETEGTEDWLWDRWERVAVLAPGVDPFFKAVFVFTSAWVEAKVRSTGWADCITDDRLFKYIVDSKFGKQLSADGVDSVAHAFSSLARTDPDFSGRAEVVSDAKRATAGVCALGEAAGA